MLIVIIAVLVVLYLIAKLYLSGPDLSMYDSPIGEWFSAHIDDKAADQRFLSSVSKVRKSILRGRSLTHGLKTARMFADSLSDELKTDTDFRPVTADGVSGEWAIRDNSDHSRRTLFLHGGAFIFGSSKGHRIFTDKLAKITGGVVLSIDYRLLPENKRQKSIDDSQTAYQWLLHNGPDDTSHIQELLVAGDSAGGNLALMLSAWSNGHATRRPDAVMAFSPNADMTLASPTIKRHQKTDKMLGEGLGLLSKLPLPIRGLLSTILMRCNPANPLVSPLFQDLSNLPPTLIHASSNEMLLGDAIRYTNKANISGSDVTLQVWENQIHDWHLFNIGYGSANSAWAKVEQFLQKKLTPKTPT